MAAPVSTGTEPDVVLSRILRTGVALCFIGHGAFGLMTKKAWLPYFAVVGIGEPWAWRIMPWIGAADVAIGFLAFLWPCRALFVWAAGWALWTALLRPFAGQGWPEFFERAGNYGVPLAILVAVGLHGPWLARLPRRWSTLSAETRRHLAWVLRLGTATLLAGHAACALVLQKSALAHHYAIIAPGNPARVMTGVGWFEIGLALAVLTTRGPAVIGFACVWKLVTESLFLTSGAIAPWFEVVERGGSYVLPLALAYLLTRSIVPERSSDLSPSQNVRPC